MILKLMYVFSDEIKRYNVKTFLIILIGQCFHAYFAHTILGNYSNYRNYFILGAKVFLNPITVEVFNLR